ncbi:peptidoglycan/xylan/chitin deacetylase (PgdA/CDA1 family) [Arthrobacter sp. CAN_A214]|uniref:polysaccharide deacetylase family protein n=1 Tax=Arthrobacter sp. CAN_A214 TaxID=2787720 RepID=UPI0018C901E0
MAHNPGRRTVLAIGMGLILTGCGVRQATNDVVQSSAPSVPSPSNPPSTVPRLTPGEPPPVVPPPVVPPPAGPEPHRLPSRDEIIDRHAGRSPYYWGLEAPGVVSRIPNGSQGVALTLDFCGGAGGNSFDPDLISGLQRLRVPATLFLNARWVADNRPLAADLADNPLFELANHGTDHLPLSVTGNSAYGIPGTADTGSVYDEIMGNDAVLTALTGQRPRFFRPGTAYFDDVSARICHDLGLIPAGFSVNGDGGATYPAGAVTTETRAAGPGSIIIAHGNRPGSGTGPGLLQALGVMTDAGTPFLTLGDAIPA